MRSRARRCTRTRSISFPRACAPSSARRYGVDIHGELSPWARDFVEREFEGDFLRVPVERVFLSEASRVGIGTYAPHDPTTADIADLVGSVDLSKVAQIGDEGDPRAWSWSGAVYAASRGMLEMIEILKVKREFLYLLLTLTQEKNVKVSRFPLIHLDETILAHTNLAEFHKFLQEKENEALLDRMVIIKVPYALSYHDESRIYQKLVSGAPAFRNVHLDPHVLNLASVFAILTRLAKPEREGLDMAKKLRLYAGEAVEGVAETEAHAAARRVPEEGLTGSARASSSMRFRMPSRAAIPTASPAWSCCSRSRTRSRTMRAWMPSRRRSGSIIWSWRARSSTTAGSRRTCIARCSRRSRTKRSSCWRSIWTRWRPRSIIARSPIRSPARTRPADERFLRSVEEKIKVSDSGKLSFRQEVVRKAMVAFKAGREVQARQPRAHARGDRAVSVRGAPRRAAAGDLHRAARR